jgi:hypothetical protein
MKKKKKKKKPMYRAALGAVALLSLAVVSGCAGSLGWDRSTPLPTGTYRETRGGGPEFYAAPEAQSPCR